MASFEGIEGFLPPEWKEQMKKEQEKRQMEADLSHIRINDFVSRLSLDDKKTLSGFLAACVDSDHLGLYHLGRLSVLIEQESEQVIPTCPVCLASHGDANEGHKLMLKYKVNAINPDEPQVRCSNCGQVYSSLKDRMIKEPDDCEGCLHKARWG